MAIRMLNSGERGTATVLNRPLQDLLTAFGYASDGSNATSPDLAFFKSQRAQGLHWVNDPLYGASPSNTALQNNAALALARAGADASGSRTLWFKPGVYQVTAGAQAALAGMHLVGDNASFSGIDVEIKQIGGVVVVPDLTISYDPTNIAQMTQFDTSSTTILRTQAVADFTSADPNVTAGTEAFASGTSVKMTSTNLVTASGIKDLGAAEDWSGVEYFDAYIHVDTPANLAGFQFRFATDAGFANYYNCAVGSDAIRINESGWRRVRVHRSRFTTTVGAPSWSSIRYVRMIVTGGEGVTVNVHLAAIGRAEQAKGSVWMYVDDALEGAYTYGLPIMQANNLQGILGVITNFVGTPGYMTWDQIRECAEAGWEIVSHTHTHPDLSTLTAAQVRTELESSQDALRAHGYPATMLVAPYGGWSDAVDAIAQDYYLICRTYNTLDTPTGVFPPLHPRYQLYYSPLDTHPAATVTGWIDSAISTGQEMCLAWHNVAPVSGGTYEYPEADFATVCAHIRSKIDAGTLTLRMSTDVWGQA